MHASVVMPLLESVEVSAETKQRLAEPLQVQQRFSRDGGPLNPDAGHQRERAILTEPMSHQAA
jgi:hypothetical protein